MARQKAGLLYAAMVGGTIYLCAGRGRIKLFREQLFADVKADRLSAWNFIKAIRNAHRGVINAETIVPALDVAQKKTIL